MMEFRETLKRVWLFQGKRSKVACFGMTPDVDNFIVNNAVSVKFVKDLSMSKM